MRHAILIMLATGTMMMSCSKKEEKQQAAPAIQVVEKTFLKESTAGCKADSSTCAYYFVKYPEFTGLNNAVTDSLRKKINVTVSMGNPELMGQDMPYIADDFIKGYDDLKKEMPEATQRWNYDATVTVQTLTDSLISLEVTEEFYTGGAHGGHGVYFINVDVATGADFTLDRLLKPGYKDALTKRGEAAFRQVQGLKDESFNAHGFQFENDQFKLNDNYGFGKDGITFYYNSYEIASYASGPTEILIPYSEIKDWLK